MAFWNRRKKGADPVIIDSPDKLAALLVGSEAGSGVNVSLTRAMRYSAYATCVRIIAEDIGKLPLFLYQQNGNMRQKAVNDSLYRILHIAPNDYMTASEFWTTCGLHLASRGNFYAFANKVRGEVRELLPLMPGSVWPQINRDWTITYRVTFRDGKYAELDQRSIFHVRVFSFDGLIGMDPISYMRESLGEGIASDNQGGKQFVNSSKLSGVLSTDGTLSDEGYKRIRESWQATYAGTDNAGKVAILEQGLKFAAISMTNEQAQFLELRKYNRGQIAGLYRIPPHMIGDVDRSTSWGSGIEQQAQGYVSNCLMAYLTAIESRIRVNLIPKAEQASKFAKFNANALLRGDMAARAEFYTRQVQNGALSPNEIREFEDMNPREGGDIFLTPANMLIDGKPAAKPPPNSGQSNS